MTIVNARAERLRRSLALKLKEGEWSGRTRRLIPGEKVLRDLKRHFRMEAKKKLMPKPYRHKSCSRGYLFEFRHARGIGMPDRVRL
jgi:hypothetical protein